MIKSPGFRGLNHQETTGFEDCFLLTTMSATKIIPD
jgi:hypothetical protein